MTWDVLSGEERSQLVSLLLVESIIPAFQETPGTSLLVIEGEPRKTFTNPPRAAE